LLKKLQIIFAANLIISAVTSKFRRRKYMLMSIIAWIVFGALAGWIASLIMRTDAEQGALGNIVVGIAGAFIGGFLVQALTGNDVNGFNLTSLIVAIVGAVILLAIVKALRGAGSHSHLTR
jgi:uncharacterized membrane protein YeaQ/YmgE (transglycosylase-associated protein family)